MKILFMCKHNRFRSKVAQAILEKMAKSEVEARSVGLSKDVDHPYVARTVHEAMAKKGYKINDEKFVPFSVDAVNWADLIIVTANDILPDRAIPKNKVRVWKISDCDESESKCIMHSIDNLEKYIKLLVKEFNL